MSRPLVLGLVAEGTSDLYFLSPLVTRQVRALPEKSAGADVDLAGEPLLCLTATMVSDTARLHREIRELARRCHVLFIHSDANEQDKAESLVWVVEPHPAAPVIVVPKRETEAWILVDPVAFAALRGANTAGLPASAKAVEKVPNPKNALKKAVAAVAHNQPEDYFEVLGHNVDLDVLGQVPAYADWVSRTAKTLKELHFL